MSDIIEVSDGNFGQEVLEAQVPVVVDFWAPWCGPCRMMAPVFDKVSEILAGQVKFTKLNTDENVKTAMQYKIQAIPSLVIFSKGKEVGRNIGFIREKQLESMLREIISGTRTGA